MVLLNEVANRVPAGKGHLVVPQPFEAYDSWCVNTALSNRSPKPSADTADIHPTVVLGPGVVIANHVRIGAYATHSGQNTSRIHGKSVNM
ncbi:MAG: hypothetical protein IPL27_26155 [Lewinellaceae bacterium]|nr:hypothetical protein [Lewinellaceae bacterium]